MAEVLLRLTKSKVVCSLLMIKIEFSVFLEVHRLVDRHVIEVDK